MSSEQDNQIADSGLFGDSEDDCKDFSKQLKKEKTDVILYGGSGGEEGDSDIDRPPLTEADKRRKMNKQRSKVKTRLTLEEIEAFKKRNEEKKAANEKKKK